MMDYMYKIALGYKKFLFVGTEVGVFGVSCRCVYRIHGQLTIFRCRWDLRNCC